MMYLWSDVIKPFGSVQVLARRRYEGFQTRNWYLFERDGLFSVFTHLECTAGGRYSSGVGDDRHQLETQSDLKAYQNKIETSLAWVPRERISELLNNIRQKNWQTTGSHQFVESVETWLNRPVRTSWWLLFA